MNKKIARISGIAAAAAILVAGAAGAASAAVQTNGSDGPLHFFDGDSGTLISPATSIAFNGAVIATGSSSDVEAPIECSSDSTGYAVFLSSRGDEETKANWKAWTQTSTILANKRIVQESMTPNDLQSGTGKSQVKTDGGNYSLGIACTKANGVQLTGTTFYRHIVVTAGTGAYTATATSDVSTPTPTPTPTTDPTLTGSIALSATTTAAVNGTLSLSVPANAAANFGAPTLVNNKSTTTGTLPNVTVVDGRVVTRQGWTLSANVADFVNATDNAITIGKTNLGVAPSVVAGSTTATGVTAGTATVAGSAAYPMTFAEGAANNTVGNSVLGGNLTFVAPQEKAAGTYTSTLTLTLVSK
jgi:hypothetical protein